MSKRLSVLSAVVLGFALLAGACGSDSDSSSSSSSDTAAPATTAAASGGDHLGDGSLGEVTVSAGDAIQIRSLNAISGDVAFLGVPNENGIRMAVADYGQIHGFDVDLGAGLDDLCSADGGQAAAQIIVADEHVIGTLAVAEHERARQATAKRHHRRRHLLRFDSQVLAFRATGRPDDLRRPRFVRTPDPSRPV